MSNELSYLGFGESDQYDRYSSSYADQYQYYTHTYAAGYGGESSTGSSYTPISQENILYQGDYSNYGEVPVFIIQDSNGEVSAQLPGDVGEYEFTQEGDNWFITRNGQPVADGLGYPIDTVNFVSDSYRQYSAYGGTADSIEYSLSTPSDNLDIASSIDSSADELDFLIEIGQGSNVDIALALANNIQTPVSALEDIALLHPDHTEINEALFENHIDVFQNTAYINKHRGTQQDALDAAVGDDGFDVYDQQEVELVATILSSQLGIDQPEALDLVIKLVLARGFTEGLSGADIHDTVNAGQNDMLGNSDMYKWESLQNSVDQTYSTWESSPLGHDNRRLADEWFDDVDPGADNEVKLKGDIEGNLNQSVTQIRMRSNGTPGGHHELMITLDDGTLVRISRNNASDTFQVGALEHGNFDMPTQQTHIPPEGVTLEDILTSFRDTHDAMPHYDQGDCIAFSEQVVNDVFTSHGAEAPYEIDSMGDDISTGESDDAGSDMDEGSVTESSSTHDDIESAYTSELSPAEKAQLSGSEAFTDLSQENWIKGAQVATEVILEHYPPEDFGYVGLGASPDFITSMIRANDASANVANIPLSGITEYLQAHPGLTVEDILAADEDSHLVSYFSEALGEMPEDIVLLDVTSTGNALDLAEAVLTRLGKNVERLPLNELESTINREVYTPEALEELEEGEATNILEFLEEKGEDHFTLLKSFEGSIAVKENADRLGRVFEKKPLEEVLAGNYELPAQASIDGVHGGGYMNHLSNTVRENIQTNGYTFSTVDDPYDSDGDSSVDTDNDFDDDEYGFDDDEDPVDSEDNDYGFDDDETSVGETGPVDNGETSLPGENTETVSSFGQTPEEARAAFLSEMASDPQGTLSKLGTQSPEQLAFLVGEDQPGPFANALQEAVLEQNISKAEFSVNSISLANGEIDSFSYLGNSVYLKNGNPVMKLGDLEIGVANITEDSFGLKIFGDKWDFTLDIPLSEEGSITRAAVEGFQAIEGTAKFLGVLGLVVGAGMGVEAIAEGDYTQAGEAFGGLAGGIAGAETGAAIGTAIFGPVGGLVGGLIGGVLGGIGGAHLGGGFAAHEFATETFNPEGDPELHNQLVNFHVAFYSKVLEENSDVLFNGGDTAQISDFDRIISDLEPKETAGTLTEEETALLNAARYFKPTDEDYHISLWDQIKNPHIKHPINIFTTLDSAATGVVDEKFTLADLQALRGYAVGHATHPDEPTPGQYLESTEIILQYMTEKGLTEISRTDMALLVGNDDTPTDVKNAFGLSLWHIHNPADPSGPVSKDIFEDYHTHAQINELQWDAAQSFGVDPELASGGKGSNGSTDSEGSTGHRGQLYDPVSGTYTESPPELANTLNLGKTNYFEITVTIDGQEQTLTVEWYENPALSGGPYDGQTLGGLGGSGGKTGNGFQPDHYYGKPGYTSIPSLDIAFRILPPGQEPISSSKQNSHPELAQYFG